MSFATPRAAEEEGVPAPIGPLLVLGGTTASGKSALALELAERSGAVIVNADSQQLFADLPILTARPRPEEQARAPHRLYGVLGPRAQPSAGRWLELVVPLLVELRKEGRPAILVGGTGLYLEALLHGLSPMPAVPAALRARLLEASRDLSTAALHARLARLDPAMAARLRPSDRQRILRALEVLEATGRSLGEWQGRPRLRPVEPAALLGMALLPPAAITSARIERRLAEQLAAGALEEVAELAQREPELGEAARAGRLEAWPILKVHGCRELMAVLEGRLDRSAASAAIARQVRAYAKRQRTWFRHRLPELEAVPASGEEPGLRDRLLGRWLRLLEAGGPAA